MAVALLYYQRHQPADDLSFAKIAEYFAGYFSQQPKTELIKLVKSAQKSQNYVNMCIIAPFNSMRIQKFKLRFKPMPVRLGKQKITLVRSDW